MQINILLEHQSKQTSFILSLSFFFSSMIQIIFHNLTHHVLLYWNFAMWTIQLNSFHLSPFIRVFCDALLCGAVHSLESFSSCLISSSSILVWFSTEWSFCCEAPQISHMLIIMCCFAIWLKAFTSWGKFKRASLLHKMWFRYQLSLRCMMIDQTVMKQWKVRWCLLFSCRGDNEAKLS